MIDQYSTQTVTQCNTKSFNWESRHSNTCMVSRGHRYYNMASLIIKEFNCPNLNFNKVKGITQKYNQPFNSLYGVTSNLQNNSNAKLLVLKQSIMSESSSAVPHGIVQCVSHINNELNKATESFCLDNHNCFSLIKNCSAYYVFLYGLISHQQLKPQITIKS